MEKADEVSISSTKEETLILNESISRALDLSRKLTDRLSPVLRENLPESGNSVTGKEKNLTPLASSIRESRYLAQTTVHTLNDILIRLDV